jgi:hypothetical protein
MCAHENRSGRYANFCAFVKNFVKCDSISTIRQVAAVRVGKGPMLQEDSLTLSAIMAICVHPDPVVGFDSL